MNILRSDSALRDRDSIVGGNRGLRRFSNPMGTDPWGETLASQPLLDHKAREVAWGREGAERLKVRWG